MVPFLASHLKAANNTSGEESLNCSNFFKSGEVQFSLLFVLKLKADLGDFIS